MDGPAIHHRLEPFERILREEVAASHEVIVTDLQGCGKQPTHVDLCAGAEQNPIGVDQENPAVRLELAQDDGWIHANDTVQGDRVHRRLEKADSFVCSDGKTVPVQNGFVSGLGDGEGCRRDFMDCGLPGNNMSISWKRGGKAREEDLEGGQQCAKQPRSWKLQEQPYMFRPGVPYGDF